MTAGRYHGAPGEATHIEGLSLAVSEYAPGHHLPKHAHENPFFSLLIRGHFDEDADGQARTCIPTSLVYYPAHAPHSEAFGSQGGRSFNIELGGAWLQRIRDFRIGEPDTSVEIRRSEVNWHATRLYSWFLGDLNQTGIEELVIQMLGGLVSTKERTDSARPSWLDRVLETVHEGYTKVLRVTAIADDAGVHPVHVARVFRRYHGCTIGEYIHRLRIEHACGALTERGASLSAIALQAGFADQAHFTRRFKAVTGVTPAVYRRLVVR